MRRFIEIFALVLAALLLCLPALAQQDIISTVIGGGPNDYPATDANLNQPDAVAVDAAGNFYVSAFAQNRIFKVDTHGTLTVFVGQGIAGYAGDGVKGGATLALINGPQGLAVDATGNVYFSDYNNCVVRKVDTANTVTTIAGMAGRCSFGGDGGKGTAANLNFPVSLALDNTAANLYIADMNNCRVRKLTLKSDVINTYAGNGSCTFAGDNGPALAASLNGPDGVAVDTAGNLFIADTRNVRIREVTIANKKINTVGGDGTSGCNGDGNSALNANISTVVELSVSSDGTTVTYADQNCQKIRQFIVGGNINTVAGNGSACFGVCGDGGSALSASFDNPQGIALASGTKTFLVADLSQNRVREFVVGGNINGVAGNGSGTIPTLLDKIAPSGVVLNNPYGVFEDSLSNVFFSDTSNQIVRELVHSTDLVDFFAGDGVAGFSGDGGPATKAQLNAPHGVAKDAAGNVYIADESNQVIRKVDSSGKITTFAGTPGNCRFAGDGGPATSAFLCNPVGVFADKNNNVYIADDSNCVVREVSGGTINTIAGIGGQCTYSGDGGPAIDAGLRNPTGVAVDGQGNVYIADASNCRVREVSALTGIITTVAGNGSCTFTGDGPATQSSVNSPNGVAVDGNGNLFIADTSNQLVRWVDAFGNMTTIAGNRGCTFSGDGVIATNSSLCNPTGISLDTSGNYLIADESNFRIRGVSAFAALTTSSSSLSFPLTSVGSTSNPQIVTLTALGPLTISNIQVTGDFSEADNCPSSLPNGQTCTMDVYFSPTGSGTRIGTVTINHNGFFNPFSTISLSGLGTAIAIGGAPVNFGGQQVKTSSGVKNVTVKNAGSNSITMGAITLSETTDFAIKTNNCPASGQPLTAGSSCTIGVTFTPKTTGAKKGAVVINDSDPSTPQLAGLSGTGTSQVLLTPGAVNFGNVPVGVLSPVATITLINNTGNTITLGNPAVTASPADFVINKGKTTCTNSLQVAASGTCVIGVQFKPSQMFYRAGLVSVADNDSTSPQTVAVSGTGIAIGFTPASLNFGTVTHGQCSSFDTVTITNSGPATVTFNGSDVVGQNSTDFREQNSTCSTTLGPGANCNILIQFCPNTTKKESATYELFDNSLASPQKLPMVGTGQ